MYRFTALSNGIKTPEASSLAPKTTKGEKKHRIFLKNKNNKIKKRRADGLLKLQEQT